jgi:hypothetical protein
VNKLVWQRLLAVILLVIPGAIATWGFNTIRNVLFNYTADLGNEEIAARFDWPMLIAGTVAFLGGVAFIAGWVLYRDRKRNYVAPRFKAKKKNG